MSALLRSRYTPMWLIALVSVGAHLLTAGRYGFHRDELYYIACGMHLAWGYVDHPALTPLLARLAVTLFGGSLVGLRLFAALAAAAVIVLSGQIVREMRGGAFASALAAVAAAVGTVFVSAGHLFQTVPFDQVVWAVAALLLARILACGDDAAGWLWLALGATLGVGINTKSTVVALGVGIVAGVLLTPTRRRLRTRWPWLGALVAAALAAPNLFWQAAHGWPTLAFSRNSAAAYWHGRNPALFLLLQPVFVGVGALALAGVGLWWCFSARGKQFRAFGWLFVAAVVVLLAARGKEYYPAPAYLPLIAAGAVATEGAARRAAWLRPASVVAMIALALPFIPVALPVLPARAMLDAQLYTLDADNVEQIGWPELVATVNGVERLSFSSSIARDTTMLHIAGLTALHDLDLEDQPVGDLGLAYLLPLVELQLLTLTGTLVTDKGVTSLLGAGTLRALTLSDVAITDLGLLHLPELPVLEWLDLSMTPITIKGLSRVATIYHLRFLNLARTAIGDTAVKLVGQLPMLEQLDLSSSYVTDAGLEHMIEYTALRNVFLSSTAVGDMGMVHLATNGLKTRREVGVVTSQAASATPR